MMTALLPTLPIAERHSSARLVAQPFIVATLFERWRYIAAKYAIWAVILSKIRTERPPFSFTVATETPLPNEDSVRHSNAVTLRITAPLPMR